MKDSFGFKLKSDEHPRRWYERVRMSCPDRFQELDFLLKGIDRFLDVSAFEMFTETPGAVTNFKTPLTVVLDGVLNLLGVLEAIIPESQRNLYWFQRYAGNKYLSNDRKDQLRQQFVEQSSEEQSLLHLYDSFLNIKGVIGEILKGGAVTFAAFENVGEIIKKDIRVNVHFNPFRKKKVDPVVDGIHNPALAGLVGRIQDPVKRRPVALGFLHLFRVLRYLEYIDSKDFRFSTLNVSLLALALVQTELKTFLRVFSGVVERFQDTDLEDAVTAVTMQLKMEMRRVYSQELSGVLEVEDAGLLRGRIENAHGILKNVIEQSVVSFAQALDASIGGEDVFASFTTRYEQSSRLRQDLMVLHRLVEEFEDDISSRKSTFGALLNYMLFFENETFKLLRYNDYEGFVSFFSWFKSLDTADLRHKRRLKEIVTRMSYFKIYLETTLQHVGLRAELAQSPADPDRIAEIVERYLPPHRSKIVFRMKK